MVAVKRAAVVQPVKSIFTTTGIELLGAMSPNATLGRDCGAPPFTITVPTTGEQATPPLCTSVKLVIRAPMADPGPLLTTVKLHWRFGNVPLLPILFAPRLVVFPAGATDTVSVFEVLLFVFDSVHVHATVAVFSRLDAASLATFTFSAMVDVPLAAIGFAASVQVTA